MSPKKFCPKCKERKVHAEFFVNKARHDGLSGYCRRCQTAANLARVQVLRMRAIDTLGGPVCVRCGFNDVRALTIDHRNGGGTQHRRSVKSLWSIYKHVIDHPEDYQVLCWNCNYIKRVENGEVSSTEYKSRSRAMHETVTL
jgi:hypothetical protein